MIKQNQSGVSLVEVLAIIVITAIFSILAWSIFFQGSDYSKTAMTKNQMYQEANHIISELTKVHQSNKEYVITQTNACTFEVSKIEDSGESKIFEKKHGQLCYTITPVTVQSNQTNIQLQLTINNKNEENNEIVVTIQLNRLIGG